MMTLRFSTLIAAVALATAGAPGSARAPGPAPATSAATTQQMDRISVQMLGTSGTPVILVPGLSSSRAVWDGIAPELAKTHRVFLVQVNGFGGDDPRGNVADGVLAGVVDDIGRLIGTRHLDHVALVGHSMGGLVGLMLAERDGAMIDRLMVVDALPFFPITMAPPGVDLTVAMVEPQAAGMRDAVAGGYGKPADPVAAEATAAGLALSSRESRAGEGVGDGGRPPRHCPRAVRGPDHRCAARAYKDSGARHRRLRVERPAPA